jgi:hypothetical protein
MRCIRIAVMRHEAIDPGSTSRGDGMNSKRTHHMMRLWLGQLPLAATVY